MRSSRLVAESLRVLPVPGANRLPPMEWAEPALLQRLIDCACQPARSTSRPPACLFDSQHDTWRRVVAAVQCFGGAILAEPVGSGKSWIALAAAREIGGNITVVGPATLKTQWMATADRIGLRIHWHSHELASRGRLPGSKPGFVIIDEAHRFRHLETSRARCIAPWLAGTPTLLLTATPIVNRRADLVALLRLIMPDDALLLDGVPSIRAIAEADTPPPALTRVVIRSQTATAPVAITQRRIRAGTAERQRGAELAALTTRLRLGDEPGVRSLVMGVLLEAGASSDAAWQAALRRYRGLLLQSRDAGGLSRAALRQFVGEALDQLLLWTLLPSGSSVGAPPLDDLPLVEEMLTRKCCDQSWLLPLAGVLSDNVPTICFTRHRATALAAVRHLGEGTAWVTGDAAGVGPHRLTREQALGAFGPAREEWHLLRNRPTILVTTEVVSEGLDLQGANRVVHLDLPWHASRLEQRTGRVARIGQRAGAVEVIERSMPPALERLLGMRRRVRSKGRLAARWLDALACGDAAPPPLASRTFCAVAPRTGDRIATALVAVSSGRSSGTIALELSDDSWQVVGAPHLPTRLLRTSPEDAGRIARLARSAAWRALELCCTAGVSRPRLQGRLIALARRARERRDAASMARIDRLLQAAGRAGPLGTEQLLTALADSSDEELLGTDLPMPAERPPVTIDWMAVVLYRPE